MIEIGVNGGTKCNGAVKIQGSKNACLPILAASLLVRQNQSILENVPRIADVFSMITLLRTLGCKVRWEGNSLLIDSQDAVYAKPEMMVAGTMRSSLFLLGAMLGAFGKAFLPAVGGCVIGERKIDFHMDAFTKMGAEFVEAEDGLFAISNGLHGAMLHLPFPSVGATENILLGAVLAKGDTVLTGAAREPEIVALCEYLCHCGASISGYGTDMITIHGTSSLHGCRMRIPADRIVAGTYLFAAAATGGTVFLQDAPVDALEAPIAVAKSMGAVCQTEKDGIYVQGPEKLLAVETICTGVYPAFPTDLQSVACVACCVAQGDSCIEERVFENRFHILHGLEQMGARFERPDNESVLFHGGSLHGAVVESKELRGGAALVIAGILAKGTTRIRQPGFIERGYENICRDLRELGARVTGV